MLTIPAACLDELGGLTESDPPALYGEIHPHRAAAGLPCVASISAQHVPMQRGWTPDVVILPASACAVAAVVARHVGRPALAACMLIGHAGLSPPSWGLATLDWFHGERWVRMDDDVPALRDLPLDEKHAPRALAEAAVWLARVARIARLYPSARVSDPTSLEAKPGLPRWEVTRG